MVHITIPHDLDGRPIQDRMRWWANAYRGMRTPNVRMIADLEEAAAEIDLMQWRECGCPERRS